MELVLDLHNCDPNTFTRESIKEFFKQLCEKIDMVRCELYWWDDFETPEGEKETEPHLVGTSAVQFIMTSNITIHTLDLLGKVFLNIFSCKYFDTAKATAFAAVWFNGRIVTQQTIERR